MKLQVFLYTEYGYAQLVADRLSEKFNCKCDQIPPAYQCDEEKLVFIVYEKYGHTINEKLQDYLSELDTSKALNVAFIEISNTGNEALDEVSKLVEKNGVNVSGTYSIPIKRTLFHKGNLMSDQLEGALAFADEQGKKNFEFLRRQG
ncbi:MAG TPA: hypothetical protein DEP00_02770 [Lachnospiraceae bacterium]|jgi:flavodoxin|nr:hypothetical protein [Lachnospiraceae bacterium]